MTYDEHMLAVTDLSATACEHMVEAHKDRGPPPEDFHTGPGFAYYAAPFKEIRGRNVASFCLIVAFDIGDGPALYTMTIQEIVTSLKANPDAQHTSLPDQGLM